MSATDSLLRSALDLGLSEVSFAANRVVVRSTPGPVRRGLAVALALPAVVMAFSALRHHDLVMVVLAIVLGLISLPVVLLIGATVHEKSFGRDGLENRLQLFGWSSVERPPLPPAASVVVRVAQAKGGRRFSVNVARGMELTVLEDEAQAMKVARRLSATLGLRLDDETRRG